MNVNNKTIIIASVIILALLAIFYIGYRNGYNNRSDIAVKKEIEYIEKEVELSKHKIDSIKSLVKKDTIKIKEYEEKIKYVESEYKELEPPKDSNCTKLYEDYKKSNDNLKTQIAYKDSIIIKKDTIIKRLYLTINEKDIIIKNKDLHIDLLNKNKNKKHKPFGIGVQAGATYQNNEVRPYIGGGVSYNFIRF